MGGTKGCEVEMETIETIEKAAILRNGNIYSISRPGRHHDVIRMIVESLGLQTIGDHEQGFVTSLGRFARRKPAAIIARAAGQIGEVKNTSPQDTLFSEDLW